jgi:predicted metal-dependent peptidase
MNSIEKAIQKLLTEKPFFAHFFLNSKVTYDKAGVPTAGAGIFNGVPWLIFNTEYVNGLTALETQAVIEHEILHLLFEHVYMFGDKDLDKQLANISMDCAINQFIFDLPKNGITLDWINKVVGKTLKEKETWEYYYSELLQKAEKVKSSGMEPLDEHADVSEGNISPEMRKAVIKAVADKAVNASKGDVPQELIKVLDALKTSSKLNWKQILRNFVAKSTSNTTRATRKKLNRRFGLEAPGKLKKRELVLGVCVDSSGSIDDNTYEQFMAEVVSISGATLKTYLVEADCVIQNVTTITKESEVPMIRKGDGGTAYTPAIEKCKELKCDAIIYFGDFDTSDIPTNPGVPFLWVGVGNSPKPGDFGAELRIN